MKALFLIFHGFNEANGISKKIRYQVKALKDCGVDVRLCHYDVTSYGERRWMVDDEVIADFGTGFAAKIWKRVYYSPILDYARHEGIDFVYMRSFHNASPFTLRLVKSLKRTGAKVVMEIPTYPYDQEYVTRSMKFHLAIDRCFRHKLAKALDGIVTFSNAEEIFGGNTIRISNGIDFEAIPMKQQQNDTSKELHLIGVAEVHYWHGFDRLVRGLADYYRNNPEYKEKFDTQTHDERNRFIANKAWAWAGYLSVLTGAAAAIAFKIAGMDDISYFCSIAVCLLMILYWICWLVLKRKY